MVENMGNTLVRTVPLNALMPGTTFKSNSGKQYVLWFFGRNRNAAIVPKECITRMEFGGSNNYDGSAVDEYLLHTYMRELDEEFGVDNLVEHEVDLLSLDGLDDYGRIKRLVSIPTLDLYRKYRSDFGGKRERPFFLATPFSTPSGYGSDYVECVFSDGFVYCDHCRCIFGVLPFFILKSSILVHVDC